MEKKNIIVVGSGAFGTAIANNLIENKNNNVLIYGIDKNEIDDINQNHKNSKYFSTKLNKNLKATSNKKNAFENVDIVILGIPSQVVRKTLVTDILPFIKKPAFFINLAKGIDYVNVQLLSDVLEEVIPEKKRIAIAKLSGPSFAKEVIKKEPTLLTLAVKNHKTFEILKKHLETSTMKLMFSNNVRGVEAISVIKNPMAIILGMLKGLGYKMNATAFIYTMCIQEMQLMLKLFEVEDSSQVIFSSAGIGDLLLTGTSFSSRNYMVGYKIGKNDLVNKEILNTYSTVEGLKSIELITALANKKQIKLPIIEMLYNIKYKNENPSKIVERFFNQKENK